MADAFTVRATGSAVGVTAGAVVSIWNAVSTIADTLPAASVERARTVCAPSAVTGTGAV